MIGKYKLGVICINIKILTWNKEKNMRKWIKHTISIFFKYWNGFKLLIEKIIGEKSFKNKYTDMIIVNIY